MPFESKNPATGELLNSYPEHTAQEIEERLEKVWHGWKHWSRTPVLERTTLLVRMAELLEQRAEQYAKLITQEMGKPLSEAIGEVKKAAFGARHFAEAGSAYIQPEPVAGTPGRVVYESLGPVLAIMPWNLPFWQVLRFFLPTALVGNTVLVKHAETVQGCAAALESLVAEAGGPAGLYVNLAVQTGAVPAIIADPR